MTSSRRWLAAMASPTTKALPCRTLGGRHKSLEGGRRRPRPQPHVAVHGVSNDSVAAHRDKLLVASESVVVVEHHATVGAHRHRAVLVRARPETRTQRVQVREGVVQVTCVESTLNGDGAVLARREGA